MSPRRALAPVLLLAVAAARPGAQGAPDPAAAPAPVSVPAPAASLGEARARLAAAAGKPGYSKLLFALADSLAPAEALQLLLEASRALPPGAERSAALMRGGDFALLLGRFADAATAYEELATNAATGRDPTMLLRAARSRLAAGEADRARDLASLVLMDSRDRLLSARARLVGAWALLLDGRARESGAIAGELAGAGAPGAETFPAELRREALFLCWAAASPEARRAAASALVSAFPGSPEALIASGAASPAPLPHWYLGALGAGPTPPATGGAAAPPPPPGAQVRLQVGYFSREENARRLGAELAGKGFDTSVEARPGTAGTRWIVLVAAGPDPDRTRLRLKDSGYESWPMD